MFIASCVLLSFYRVLLVVCCSLLVCCCWLPRRLSLLFDICRLQFGGVCCLMVAVFCVLSGVLCFVFVARVCLLLIGTCWSWCVLLVVCWLCVCCWLLVGCDPCCFVRCVLFVLRCRLLFVIWFVVVRRRVPFAG